MWLLGCSVFGLVLLLSIVFGFSAIWVTGAVLSNKLANTAFMLVMLDIGIGATLACVWDMVDFK